MRTKGGQDRFAFEFWYLGHTYVGSVLRAMLTMLQAGWWISWLQSDGNFKQLLVWIGWA